MKTAIFILGLLVGINIGYLPIIFSHSSTDDLKKCVDDYAHSVSEWKKIEALCEDNANNAIDGWTTCKRNLTECVEDLSLLQGRSK